MRSRSSRYSSFGSRAAGQTPGNLDLFEFIHRQVETDALGLEQAVASSGVSGRLFHDQHFDQI